MRIEFLSELSIPMEMPFRGADISLIIGNLLENAVEGADKAEGKKYIRFTMKYDRNNLLITVENSYTRGINKGKRRRTADNESGCVQSRDWSAVCKKSGRKISRSANH